jgi:hypothetical protein
MSSTNLTTRVQDVTFSAVPDCMSADQVCVKNLYVASGQSSPNVQNVSVVSLVGTGGITLTPAQVKSGYVKITGAGAYGLTLPAAADIVSSISNCAVGDSFSLLIENQVNNTATLAAGTGNTLKGAATTIATLQGALLKFVVTNVTALSEACFVLCTQ